MELCKYLFLMLDELEGPAVPFMYMPSARNSFKKLSSL